jgi:glycerol-1-phosphate dehydrogenase [NAD(P)+]
LGSAEAWRSTPPSTWRSAAGLRLYLVPTIASGNGPFTRNIAIRRGGVPVGSAADFTPEAVLVDSAVIRQARPAYNRSGISDVLSSYTALIDWRAAASAGQAEWRDDLAEVSRRMRAKVAAAASEIGEVSDAGIRTLMEAFAEGAESAASKPGQRMFTGSDHLFAWNLEATTGRHFLHGEVVGLGILLMYAFQGNDPEEPRRALTQAQVRYLPEELGVTRAELLRTLVELPGYARDVRKMYTVLDERPMTPAIAERLMTLVGM